MHHRAAAYPFGVAVYNFCVASFHTYFVSSKLDNLPVHVHNARYTRDNPKHVQVDHRKSPKSAKHLMDIDVEGKPLQVNRTGAGPNRKVALRGKKKVPKHDLDEAPPAVLRKRKDSVSVRAIPSGDNRSAGAQIGAQLRGVRNGDWVTIKIINKPRQSGKKRGQNE